MNRIIFGREMGKRLCLGVTFAPCPSLINEEKD